MVFRVRIASRGGLVSGLARVADAVRELELKLELELELELELKLERPRCRRDARPSRRARGWQGDWSAADAEGALRAAT